MKLTVLLVTAAALAALACVAPAAGARLSPASCTLSLEPAELDRLGAALADRPRRYLVLSRGSVDAVKADALAKDGFSAAAVACVVTAFAKVPNDGTGTQPSTPAGPGLSEADRKRVLAAFGRGQDAKVWRDKVSGRFGAKSTKGLSNKSMRASLVDTFDPALVDTVLEWLTLALGDQLPPWLQLLAPMMAMIMQLAMGLQA